MRESYSPGSHGEGGWGESILVLIPIVCKHCTYFVIFEEMETGEGGYQHLFEDNHRQYNKDDFTCDFRFRQLAIFLG